MKRLLLLAAAHPWSVLFFLVATSVAAATQLPKLRVDVSPQSLTVRGDPARAYYERSLATFGSDDITVIFIRDDSLFERQRLESVRRMVDALDQLPFVTRTESLFSIPNLKTVDEFVKTDPYLHQLPDNAVAAERLRTDALRNPFVRHNLLSEDGTAMAVNVYLDDKARHPGFDAEASASIEAALAPVKAQVQEAFQIGLPYIRNEVKRQIEVDQVTIIPLAIAVLLGTLLFTLRRANGAIIPMLTAGLSVLWTLGLMAALDIAVNMMTAIVPVLLIIIGSTEDIHLISEYYEGTLAGRRRRTAVRHMATRMGLAVFLTFLTSYLGFLSIAANPIDALREFGLVASTGLAFNFLITAALVPAYLRHLGDKNRPAGYRETGSIRAHIVSLVSRTVLTKRVTVAIATFLVALVAAFGALTIRVDNSLLNYFDPESAVRHRAQTLHEALSGMKTFSIVLDGHIEGTFERVRYLEEIAEIQAYLEAEPALDFNVSFADYVSLLNSAVNDTGELELPTEDEILRELTIFIKPENVRHYVSPDYSQASIVVRHNIGASQALNEALARLGAFLQREVDRGLDVRVTGESILHSRAADRMARGQAKSLGLMVLVIMLVISLLFVNIRAGLLATIPNVFPVIILFGVMGYAGIPLDSGTAMIAAIALGICVDNTMHFMVRYHRVLAHRRDEASAIRETIQVEAVPVTAASVALALGLGTLAFSQFTPIVYFGVLSAMVIAVAYYADFFITPILLSTTRLVTLWDLLSTRVRRELVENCVLFKGMRRRQIRRILLLGEIRSLPAGTTIMEAGEAGHEMFVLLDGKAEVRTAMENGTILRHQKVSTGHVFGVVALVCGRPRLATAVALEDTTLLALDWERIQRIARLCPRAAARFFQNLAMLIGSRFADHARSSPEPSDVEARDAALPEALMAKKDTRQLALDSQTNL